MKAKDVIKYMKEYHPEDELLVMWWDSDVLYNGDSEVTEDEWNGVIDTTDGHGLDSVNDEVYSILKEILFAIRRGGNG